MVGMGLDLRETTGDTKLNLVSSELNESNAEILSPAETNFCEEDERHHHAKAIRVSKS